MIVLDTNIVSEFMGTPPAAQVRAWLNAQDPASLFLTTITVAEIRFGLACLPQGRRRDDLTQGFEQFRARGFAHRVLDFDLAAADHYGDIRARRRLAGKPMSTLDGQIAAIARSRQACVATRNVIDFAACGVEVINPFEL